MEWSIKKLLKNKPKVLNSAFTINDSLDVFVIPPSQHPTILVKDKTNPRSKIYQSTCLNTFDLSNSLVPIDQDSDYKCSVTFSGKCVVNSKTKGKTDAASTTSSFSCISLPNKRIFKRPHAATDLNRNELLNRSMYLPKPNNENKVTCLPTPKNEKRIMYLPAPKQKIEHVIQELDSRNSSESNLIPPFC